MSEKRVPLRMCCACRNFFPKNELFRVVRTPDNGIVVDEKGKINGRGAYLCRTEQCLTKCRKSKILNRQLGEIDEGIYALLKEKL